MLYLVIEHYKDKAAVYRRFHEKGRMMPDGVRYVDSWVTADGSTCYQINESRSEALLHEWAANWSDVTDFEFIPVISSREMSEKWRRKHNAPRATGTPRPGHRSGRRAFSAYPRPRYTQPKRISGAPETGRAERKAPWTGLSSAIGFEAVASPPRAPPRRGHPPAQRPPENASATRPRPDRKSVV